MNMFSCIEECTRVIDEINLCPDFMPSKEDKKLINFVKSMVRKGRNINIDELKQLHRIYRKAKRIAV